MGGAALGFENQWGIGKQGNTHIECILQDAKGNRLVLRNSPIPETVVQHLHLLINRHPYIKEPPLPDNKAKHHTRIQLAQQKSIDGPNYKQISRFADICEQSGGWD